MFAGLNTLRELLEETAEKDTWSSTKFTH
jgi:hypothetical protein